MISTCSIDAVSSDKKPWPVICKCLGWLSCQHPEYLWLSLLFHYVCRIPFLLSQQKILRAVDRWPLGSNSDHIYKILLNGEKKELGREDCQDTAEMMLFLVGSKKKKKERLSLGACRECDTFVLSSRESQLFYCVTSHHIFLAFCFLMIYFEIAVLFPSFILSSLLLFFSC